MAENIRLLVLETLLEVEKKNIYVKEGLDKLLFQKQFLSKQDRAFITRMVEGVTEYQVRLDYVINCFSKTKVNKCKPLIRCVLRMGVYQMLYMDSVPNEAACDECVKLTKKKGFQNLSGFVNGVLRNIARNIESISYPERDEDLLQYLSVQYSMPLWLVEEMLGWYGEETTEKMLKASVAPPKLTIRVNTGRTTREHLKEKLWEQQIVVEDGSYVEDALILKNINYVKRLPGFKEGEFFVQDESSMLLYQVADLDENAENIRILDVCAAPGGKCTHFAAKLKEKAFVEARDLTRKKTVLIDENIERLSLSNIKTMVWDGEVLDEEKKQWADLVIADLPCSGLGIIGKKNDIKYHIRAQQLKELAALQRSILKNAAEYVKPGGILLYSTCTINPAENVENAKWFLENFDFEGAPIEMFLPEALRESMPAPFMLQLLPGVHECDGFFIAKFKKRG